MIDITVGIPVYNTEKYLQKCLDCFFIDTALTIEIIAVDDCSTDGSLAILRNNQLFRANLSVLHYDNNAGPSVARNQIMDLAKGKYIYFADSDDTLDFKGVEKLYEMAESGSLDVAIGYRYELSKTTGAIRYNDLKVRDTGVISGKDFFFLSMTDKFQGIGPPLNLYNREFMIRNGLYYVKGNSHQDNELMPRVLLAAERVYFKDIPFYCHLIRPGTLSNNDNFQKNSKDRMQIIRIHYQLLLDHISEPSVKQALRNMLAFNISHLIRSTAMLNSSEKEKIFSALKENPYLAEAVHTTQRRARLFAFCGLVNLKTTCFIYRLLMRNHIGKIGF